MTLTKSKDSTVQQKIQALSVKHQKTEILFVTNFSVSNLSSGHRPSFQATQWISIITTLKLKLWHPIHQWFMCRSVTLLTESSNIHKISTNKKKVKKAHHSFTVASSHCILLCMNCHNMTEKTSTFKEMKPANVCHLCLKKEKNNTNNWNDSLDSKKHLQLYLTW